MTQISFFDGKEKFEFSKPIRLITLFSGYDSQALALKYLGVPFEHYHTCEWAIPSIQALKDLHFDYDNGDYSVGLSKDDLVKILAHKGVSSNYNEPLTEEQLSRYGEQKLRTIFNNIVATRNLVSICNIHGDDLDIVDTDKFEYIMTYSFPCVLAGTKVITENGYKNIEDVIKGEYVLTHKNRFSRVLKTMERTSNHYYEIKGIGVPKLLLTEEHPIYVLRNNEPQWVKVKDLKTTDFFSFNINTDEKDTEISNQNLWLLGRYVADG